MPPPVYDPVNHPVMLRWIADRGVTAPELADRLGISLPTFKQWRKKYPEFRLAIRDGRRLADAKVQQALYERALGSKCETAEAYVEGDKRKAKKVLRHYPPDPACLTFYLKNRIPEKWRNKPAPRQRRVIAHVRPLRTKFHHDESNHPGESESA